MASSSVNTKEPGFDICKITPFLVFGIKLCDVDIFGNYYQALKSELICLSSLFS
jgi:hypothetical protein